MVHTFLPGQFQHAYADVCSLRKDSNTHSIGSEDTGSVRAPAQIVGIEHRVPLGTGPRVVSLITNSLASSAVKGISTIPCSMSLFFFFPSSGLIVKLEYLHGVLMTISTAVGVAIHSVAAAAVIWRVKPD
jgi:hypothetical protein